MTLPWLLLWATVCAVAAPLCHCVRCACSPVPLCAAPAPLRHCVRCACSAVPVCALRLRPCATVCAAPAPLCHCMRRACSPVPVCAQRTSVIRGGGACDLAPSPARDGRLRPGESAPRSATLGPAPRSTALQSPGAASRG
eukprot:358277-Chlamydomonas_euryale.AAC.6